MRHTFIAENKKDGFARTCNTSSTMIESRERINFMLDCIATPDELAYVEENMETIFEELGYSFTWGHQE